MFLSSLISFKVFIIIIGLVSFATIETRKVYRLLLQVLVQVRLDDLIYQVIQPVLTAHLQRHRFEENSLPKMIKLASMIFN